MINGDHRCPALTRSPRDPLLDAINYRGWRLLLRLVNWPLCGGVLLLLWVGFAVFVAAMEVWQ